MTLERAVSSLIDTVRFPARYRSGIYCTDQEQFDLAMKAARAYSKVSGLTVANGGEPPVLLLVNVTYRPFCVGATAFAQALQAQGLNSHVTTEITGPPKVR